MSDRFLEKGMALEFVPFKPWWRRLWEVFFPESPCVRVITHVDHENKVLTIDGQYPHDYQR